MGRSARNYMSAQDLLEDFKYWQKRSKVFNHILPKPRENMKASWRFLMSKWGVRGGLNDHVMDVVEGRMKWQRMNHTR